MTYAKNTYLNHVRERVMVGKKKNIYEKPRGRSRERCTSLSGVLPGVSGRSARVAIAVVFACAYIYIYIYTRYIHYTVARAFSFPVAAVGLRGGVPEALFANVSRVAARPQIHHVSPRGFLDLRGFYEFTAARFVSRTSRPGTNKNIYKPTLRADVFYFAWMAR